MKKLLFLFFILLLACSENGTDPLAVALKSDHPAISGIMQNLDSHEVQILYTRIDTTANGAPLLTEFSFQLDATHYFYPASTVKFPVAVLALEKIDALHTISRNTPYTMEGDSVVHTIEDEVRQLFAVSDNDAYNRLYEFLGRDYINAQLQRKRLQPVRISHRLATENASDKERTPLLFRLNESDTIFQSLPNLSTATDSEIQKLKLKKTVKGKGFMRNDTLIAQPMDFSEKNYLPLRTQHELLKRLFFAELFPEDQQFQLAKETQEFLFNTMHTVPRNSGYDESEFYDSYGKFFIYGDSKERMPENLKIYNKVGYAFGTLTDTAYIVDEINDIHFLLSATILVNNNEIFNDDHYEYESVGIPFLAQLGRELYRYEFARKKAK